MKKGYIITGVVSGLACAAIAFGATFAAFTLKPAKTNEEFFADAVKDAAFIDEDELLPLVTVTEGDSNVRFNDKGQVLMQTWHKYPESYPDGEEATASWGEIWVVSAEEMANKYKANPGDFGANENDLAERMRELNGIAPDKEYTTVTLMWVDPADLVRPAYQTDITKSEPKSVFDEDVDETFKGWFDANITRSYFYSAYPWTRLGYTYDWADNGTEYGLTEFLVKSGSTVTVEDTMTNAEFFDYLKSL